MEQKTKDIITEIVIVLLSTMIALLIFANREQRKIIKDLQAVNENLKQEIIVWKTLTDGYSSLCTELAGKIDSSEETKRKVNAIIQGMRKK